jgi:hypothetical protein
MMMWLIVRMLTLQRVMLNILIGFLQTTFLVVLFTKDTTLLRMQLRL